jgi:hypothetical protein
MNSNKKLKKYFMGGKPKFKSIGGQEISNPGKHTHRFSEPDRFSVPNVNGQSDIRYPP